MASLNNTSKSSTSSKSSRTHADVFPSCNLRKLMPNTRRHTWSHALRDHSRNLARLNACVCTAPRREHKHGDAEGVDIYAPIKQRACRHGSSCIWMQYCIMITQTSTYNVAMHASLHIPTSAGAGTKKHWNGEHASTAEPHTSCAHILHTLYT